MNSDHLTRDEAMEYSTQRRNPETYPRSDDGILNPTTLSAEPARPYFDWGVHIETPESVAQEFKKWDLFIHKPWLSESPAHKTLTTVAETEAVVDRGDVVRRVRGENTRVGKNRTSKTRSWFVAANSPVKRRDIIPGSGTETSEKPTRGLAAMFTFHPPGRLSSAPPTPVIRADDRSGHPVISNACLDGYQQTAFIADRKIAPWKEEMRQGRKERRDRGTREAKADRRVKKVRFRIDERVEIQIMGE